MKNQHTPDYTQFCKLLERQRRMTTGHDLRDWTYVIRNVPSVGIPDMLRGTERYYLT